MGGQGETARQGLGPTFAPLLGQRAGGRGGAPEQDCTAAFMRTTGSALGTAPRSGLALRGKAGTWGRGTRPCRGKVYESLCILVTVLTPPTTYPWGAEEGLPVPGWCEILKSPPEHFTEGGGLALNTSCLRARKSRSLVHQARGHFLPHLRGDGSAPSSFPGDPDGGSLYDTPPLGLRPAGGCTLPGRRTSSPRPRSGRHSGTCERGSAVRAWPVTHSS